MSRNSVVQEHYLKNPFRFVCPHFGKNRAQRRAEGHYDRRKKKFVVEPSRNFTYRK